MQNETQYVVRVEGLPYSYGLGEICSPEGAVLFKAGRYNLNREQLNVELKKLGKVTLR
jgi:hypothetical protein